MSLLLLLQSSGSTSYSLPCDAGNYTYTGQSTTFIASRILTANNGSYVYTGKTSSFVTTRLLTADNGSYIYTGKSATLTYTPIDVPSATKGGWSNYKLTNREKERLARLRMQQSRIRDDEEVLAIILASLTRR